MKPKTVLIIDDDFSVHDGVSAVLMREGIDTVSAGSTTAAKAALELCRVDAMLVDTALGKESGFSTLLELRRHSKAPALMLSDAVVDKALESDARKCGAKGILKKPLVPEQLAKAVSALF